MKWFIFWAMKMSKTVQRGIELAISRVRLEHACLTPPGKYWGCHEYADGVRESMRIHRETRIVPLLEAIRDGDTSKVRSLS